MPECRNNPRDRKNSKGRRRKKINRSCLHLAGQKQIISMHEWHVAYGTVYCGRRRSAASVQAPPIPQGRGHDAARLPGEEAESDSTYHAIPGACGADEQPRSGTAAQQRGFVESDFPSETLLTSRELKSRRPGKLMCPEKDCMMDWALAATTGDEGAAAVGARGLASYSRRSVAVPGETAVVDIVGSFGSEPGKDARRSRSSAP